MTPPTALFVLIVIFITAWSSSTRSNDPAIRWHMFAHTAGTCAFLMLVVMGAMDPDPNWQDHIFTGVCALFLIFYARVGPRV